MSNEIITQHFEPTKDTAAFLTNKITQAVESGETNVLLAAMQINCLELALKQAKENLKEYITTELSKYPEKSIELTAGTITKSNTTKYDYSNNEDWVKLDKICQDAEKAKKALEDKLKKIEQGCSLVNEETGEMIQAPLKLVTDNYRITLK
jgi:nitrogen regulatory protein PII-like uncharacterized protein